MYSNVYTKILLYSKYVADFKNRMKFLLHFLLSMSIKGCSLLKLPERGLEPRFSAQNQTL